jgi:hypothetical protein
VRIPCRIRIRYGYARDTAGIRIRGVSAYPFLIGPETKERKRFGPIDTAQPSLPVTTIPCPTPESQPCAAASASHAQAHAAASASPTQRRSARVRRPPATSLRRSALPRAASRLRLPHVATQRRRRASIRTRWPPAMSFRPCHVDPGCSEFPFSISPSSLVRGRCDEFQAPATSSLS